MEGLSRWRGCHDGGAVTMEGLQDLMSGNVVHKVCGKHQWYACKVLSLVKCSFVYTPFS